MSVYTTGLLALKILTHHWSICRMLQQSSCLSFFVPLSFQMTVDQPHQLQIWKRYVMTNTLKCLLFYTFYVQQHYFALLMCMVQQHQKFNEFIWSRTAVQV